jgi:O-antigen ligase
MSGRAFPAAGDAGPLSRALVPLVLVVTIAFVVSRGVTSARAEYALAAAVAASVFLLVFVKTELGLHLVVLSMLLSPEFSIGGGLAEHREVVFRSEDFLLMVIAASWFAKTAVNKELGLVVKTPLNRPILAYIVTTFLATLVGVLTGTVSSASGFFYVLKYVEYFFVYYVVVNHVTDGGQIRRLVAVAVLTAAVVSVIGIAQIPSGVRVSAPFEGEAGEPNTFGGYLLFMMAILAGVALETRHLRLRVAAAALVGLLAMPFAFTLSRASYLGVLPAVGVLAVKSRRRRLMVGLLLVLVVTSPLMISVLPAPVVKRVIYTFRPEGHQSVRIGRLGFDPSTSARFVSFREAFDGWRRRPILGWGVTGFGFMDAQYARTLVETGIVGLAAFLWLVVSVVRSGMSAFRRLSEPDERGLALGFIAGTAGLLTHAIGSNTFIIIRIMEPFWLFAGLVMILPSLGTARPEARGLRPSATPATDPARVPRRILPPLGGSPRADRTHR